MYRDDFGAFDEEVLAVHIYFPINVAAFDPESAHQLVAKRFQSKRLPDDRVVDHTGVLRRDLKVDVHADALCFGDFNDAGGYGEVL